MYISTGAGIEAVMMLLRCIRLYPVERNEFESKTYRLMKKKMKPSLVECEIFYLPHICYQHRRHVNEYL